MKRYLFLALSLVLVGAGCARPVAPQQNAEPTPQPVNEEPAPQPEPITLEDGLYQLDLTKSTIKWQASKVNVRVTHNGEVKAKEGMVRVDGGVATEGSMLVDMNTIRNFDQQGKFLKMLEDHLRSTDFFDVAQFPTASFAITKMEPIEGIEGSNFRFDGELTIKSTTKPISFSGLIEEVDGGLHLTSRVTVDRAEFDVRFGSGKFFENLGDGLIDDKFYLTLDLLFIPSEEEASTEGDIQGS